MRPRKRNPIPGCRKGNYNYRVGKVSGLGVQATWVEIFKTNELRDDPLTDRQIANLMVKNFPNPKRRIYRRVSEVRCRFNRGELTHGVIPKVKSVRHGPPYNPFK